MSVHGNQRVNKRASDSCLMYFLTKYRDQLMKQDNDRRNQLKAGEHHDNIYILAQQCTRIDQRSDIQG